MGDFDTGTIIASTVWSGIGMGYWVYGKKQRSMPPMVGGIALTAASWLVTGLLWMSLACIAIIVGTHVWLRNED